MTGSELGVEIFVQGVKAGQAFCVSFDNLNHRLLRGKLLNIRFLINLGGGHPPEGLAALEREQLQRAKNDLKPRRDLKH